MVKIDAIEQKQSKTGKQYAIIWSGNNKGSFWDPVTFKVGDEVDGEFVASGDFVNFKLNKPAPAYGPSWKRSGAAQQAQEVRDASIKVAQENREKGVSLSGAMRDATLVALREIQDIPFPDERDFKNRWEHWRDFFLKEHENMSARLKQEPFL